MNIIMDVIDDRVWHLREKYVKGGLTIEAFEAQVGDVLAGNDLILEPGELQQLPPGPPVLVRR